METINPAVMIDQVASLPDMIRHHVPLFTSSLEATLANLDPQRIEKVLLVGCGDSFHASISAAMAVNAFSGVDCRSQPAFEALSYGDKGMGRATPERCLVIGISASGATKTVAHALEQAARQNISTLAMVGSPNGPVSNAARSTLSVEVPFHGVSPGIRTYVASLLGLFLFTIRIGEDKGVLSSIKSSTLREELLGVADTIETTYQITRSSIEDTAREFLESPMLLFLGSGPSFGTAKHSAAKVIEASGVFAVAQDLEEWAHVERFSYPDDMPTCFIIPHGHSESRATTIARQAKDLGRRVMVIPNGNNHEFNLFADFVHPVIGAVREEFSPLVFHLGGTLLASCLAQALNRKPFQSHRLH
jgi:glucosamine--fructose-6-phosphate aminotransferase (isomerizing)